MTYYSDMFDDYEEDIFSEFGMDEFDEMSDEDLISSYIDDSYEDDTSF